MLGINGKGVKMAGTSSVGVSESQGAHHHAVWMLRIDGFGLLQQQSISP